MCLFHILTLSIILWCDLFGQSIALSKHPVIILTAFDGFRHDYLSRGLTPTLEKIANSGSKAKFMLNQFPTITFPNFHSISTGMHVETHGVIGNYAFNENKQCLNYSYELFHYNEEIVPLWNLNEMSGDGRHSGTMMWIGSDFKYQDRYPTFHQDLILGSSWFKRVDTVVSWITHPTTPANLVYLYFEQPDISSHQYGPDSVQVNAQLRRIDEIVLYFGRKLVNEGLWDRVNLIFLADHGASTVKSQGVIDLTQYLSPESYTLCGSSPGLHYLPKPGFEDQVYANLTAASKKLKTFQVYKPNDIPDRWFYKNNPRIQIGYFVQSDDGYVFQDAKNLKGDHGYDNRDPKMHPMFFAYGPLFKKNYEVDPFHNIDLYPFIAHILKLQSLPEHVTPNGTLNSNVVSILNEDAISKKDNTSKDDKRVKKYKYDLEIEV